MSSLHNGNVLTVNKLNRTALLLLRFTGDQNTRGFEREFWVGPCPDLIKFSMRAPFFLAVPREEYRVNTNMNGGYRAFVATGIYEKVLPMNIYPMQLFKAIHIEDIDLWRS